MERHDGKEEEELAGTISSYQLRLQLYKNSEIPEKLYNNIHI